MPGDIPPLPQYNFMEQYLVKHRDILPYPTLPYGNFTCFYRPECSFSFLFVFLDTL